MPDARDLIERGIRHQNGGAIERALDAFSAAAQPMYAPRDRAEALRRSADVHRSHCDWGSAIPLAQESAAIAAAADLHDLHAEALNAEAAVYHSRGELDRAHALYSRMLELAENPRIRGISLQNLGSIAAARADFDTAEERFIESFECFQRADYRRGVVIALNNRGRVALDRGAWEDAHPILVHAETNARQLLDLDLHALVRVNLGESFMRRGELGRAEELASAALGHFVTIGNDWRRLECLRLLGDIALERDRVDSARNFFSAALRLAETTEASLEMATLSARMAAVEAMSAGE